MPCHVFSVFPATSSCDGRGMYRVDLAMGDGTVDLGGWVPVTSWKTVELVAVESETPDFTSGKQEPDHG